MANIKVQLQDSAENNVFPVTDLVRRVNMSTGSTTNDIPLSGNTGTQYLVIANRNNTDNADQVSVYSVFRATGGAYIVKTIKEYSGMALTFAFSNNLMSVTNGASVTALVALIKLF